MRGRYAVAFGRGAHRHALREKAPESGLEIKADLDGLLVVGDAMAQITTGAQSAAVGQMFTLEDEPLQVLDTSAEHLPFDPDRVGRWGDFTFFSAVPGEQPLAYRDPSGGQLAYHLLGSGGDLFVSDAELAISLGLIGSTAIDLTFVTQWLQFPHFRGSRSGLMNVRELLPGTMRRQVDGEWIDELRWDPWRYAGSRAIRDGFQATADTLRSTALRTIALQVSDTPAMVQLSGGVDSSIIAASLHHAGIEFSAVTFATRSADGDERRYARSVAAACGASLKEITEDELPCVLMSPAELTFRPGSNPVLLPLDQAVEQHRLEAGRPLLIDGGGGDNVFCYLSNAAPVLDALVAARPGAALAAARDIAARAESTLWQVAIAAWRRSLSATGSRWREDRSFLTRDALLSAPDPHPWLAAPRFSPPGKRDHVASLVQIQHFLDRRISASTPSLHPLMARPLLELCLATPTWDWVRGGIDRAVARQAFRDLIPGLVISRRSKGTLQGLFQRFFMRMRSELKDLLLSGELRRLSIIDAAAVEVAFAGDDWAVDEVQMRLSEMSALELWLQSWRR